MIWFSNQRLFHCISSFTSVPCMADIAAYQIDNIFSVMQTFNSFGAKFQTIFVVCVFFILTNYRLERRPYVKLKNWMSNSVDPDETAHWAVSIGSVLFAKAYYYRLWQWKSEAVICIHFSSWSWMDFIWSPVMEGDLSFTLNRMLSRILGTL